MVATPDLTLPDTIPEMEQYHHTPGHTNPFALYTLCDIDESTFESYRRRCNTDINDEDGPPLDDIKFPPQARFVGDRLQSIVDYHLELARGGEFDERNFAVVVYPKSTSVVVVILDDDDLDCKPDLLWAKMEDVATICNNIQIGNVDWYDYKEDDLGGPTFPGDDDNDDGDDGNDDDSDHSEDDESDDNNEGETGYGKAPGTGFHIQVYTLPSLDAEAFLKRLEPMSYMKKADQSDWVCKIHKLPEDAIRDPVKYAVGLHPYQCSIHPTLHRKYFIVADELEYVEEGVAIVHIDWDGNTEGKSKDQLLDFGKSLMYQTRRGEIENPGPNKDAVFTITLLAGDHLTWQPKTKQFAVYSNNDGKLADAIDPRHWKRKHGEDRMAYGGFPSPEEIEKGGGLWPTLIRKHVEFCKKNKFVVEFVRQYFMLCDEKEPTEKSEVQLVKLDWNGDFRQKDALAADYEKKVTAMKAPASKAHKELSDIVDGSSEWSGKSVS